MSDDLTNRFAHRPPHKYSMDGIYMITAGTLYKKLLFKSPEKLTMLQDVILEQLIKYQWAPKAWAIFANHYHLIIENLGEPTTLPDMMQSIHKESAF